MTGRYQLHPSVWEDLFGIWSHIAKDSPAAADRLEEELRNAFASLEANPYSGHVRPDLAGPPLRFWTVRHYLVGYDPEERPPLILMVVHGMRDPDLILRTLTER